MGPEEKSGEIWVGFNLWFLGREDNGFWGGTRSGNGAGVVVVVGWGRTPAAGVVKAALEEAAGFKAV